MIFYEKIGIFCFFFHLITGRQAFYWRRNFFLYLLWNVFPNFFSGVKICTQLAFGHVQHVTDVMKNSFLYGQAFINEMQHEHFFREGKDLFNLDFIPIFKRFIFSEVVCPKYEFFEVAMRYVAEHPEQKHFFSVSDQLSSIYLARLKRLGTVRINRSYNSRMAFVFSIVLAPVLLWSYWKTKGQRKDLYFNNNIICNTQKISVYDIYKELFGKYHQTKYIISGPYPTRASSKGWKKLGIIHVGLDKAGYDYLRKHVFRYVYLCLKHSDEIAVYGIEMLRLFYDIIVGRAEATHGQGNLFFTYDHFYTKFAIRNEFIKLEGSKSVFFSQTLNLIVPYEPDEIKHNYDIVCSSGKHLEDVLFRNKASTQTFLPTGSYDAHRGTIKIADYHTRVEELRAFKDKAVAITILSTGLVDKSYSAEIRLMELARKLSQQQNVKVFVRMKSRFCMPEHDGFYDEFTNNERSIFLTGAEYELLDFLSVTDLFVTSFSSSGCDVAMYGGQIMYVDFLKFPDIFLFWEKINGVFVSEETAFDEIMKWVNDSKNGPIRATRKEAMARLREYMGYTFPDFESYKKNLINQLSNHSPLFIQDKNGNNP